MPVIDFCGVIPDPELMRAFLAGFDDFPGYLRRFGGAELIDQIAVPPDEYVDQLRANGIDHSVVHGSGGELNDAIARVAARHPDALTAYCGVRADNGIEELDRGVNELGMRGLTIAPFTFGETADSGRLRPIFERAAELGVPAWVHTGNHWADDRVIDIGHPRHVDALACALPELTIIIGHSGWPWLHESILCAWRHPNVYLETSAHRPAWIARPGSGWEPFGFLAPRIRTKILFGTDWVVLRKTPWDLAAEAGQLGLDEQTTTAWLYDNARKLLGE